MKIARIRRDTPSAIPCFYRNHRGTRALPTVPMK